MNLVLLFRSEMRTERKRERCIPTNLKNFSRYSQTKLQMMDKSGLWFTYDLFVSVAQEVGIIFLSFIVAFVSNGKLLQKS